MPRSKPIIFLAFANDRDNSVRYLRNLPEEARQIRNSLQRAHQADQCEVVVRQNVTLQDVLDVFQEPEYRNRITVFHFGGHANGYQLLLESASGQPAIAHAEGLAGFLGQQRGLNLIFLNGCSTRQQVEGLLAAQIPAVIATDQAIDDEVAVKFAGRLYKGLAGGANLRTAYQEAQAAVQLRWGSGHRGLYYLEDETEPAPDRWPWELYLRSADESAADWHLPPPPEPEAEQVQQPSAQLGGVNISDISDSSINIGGNVSADVQAGGDVVGGDKVVQQAPAPQAGDSPQAALEAALAQWRQEVETLLKKADDLDEDDREYVQKTARKMAAEAKKGQAADPAKIEGFLKRLGNMAPDIVEVTAKTLQNPFAGVGLVLEKINDRIKLERANR